MTGQARRELALDEAAWMSRVMDYARLRGWLRVHIRPARTSRRWRTPYEGDPGLPDLVLARDGQVLLVELKVPRGRTTAEQDAWLAAAGQHGRLWRPEHWPRVMDELR